MSREVMQQALDALKSGDVETEVRAVEALKAALAQPQAEPVAYAQNPKDDFWCWCNADEQGAIPLYAAPQAQPAPAVPAVQPLSGDVLYALWASENGLEDCKLCRLNDFTKAARFFERELGIAAPGSADHD